MSVASFHSPLMGRGAEGAGGTERRGDHRTRNLSSESTARSQILPPLARPRELRSLASVYSSYKMEPTRSR